MSADDMHPEIGVDPKDIKPRKERITTHTTSEKIDKLLFTMGIEPDQDPVWNPDDIYTLKKHLMEILADFAEHITPEKMLHVDDEEFPTPKEEKGWIDWWNQCRDEITKRTKELLK